MEVQILNVVTVKQIIIYKELPVIFRVSVAILDTILIIRARDSNYSMPKVYMLFSVPLNVHILNINYLIYFVSFLKIFIIGKKLNLKKKKNKI